MRNWDLKNLLMAMYRHYLINNLYMSKYDNIKYFKETKARADHICSNCREQINAGDIYYPEEIKDKFLHSLHRKKLCKKCYQNMEESK